MKIRFRVWDGTRMWYPTESDDLSWRMSRDGLVWRVTAFYDETLEEKYMGAVAMLSTGLEDKNGKEVFDGDILECENTIWGAERPPLKIKVEWDSVKGKWHTGYGERGENDLCGLYKTVIGNVHENKELMEG